jgi:hypothetical protein
LIAGAVDEGITTDVVVVDMVVVDEMDEMLVGAGPVPFR